jgi:hypothetical protein
MDCSNCANVVNGSSPVCRILNKVYPISDYPNQGLSCTAWTQGKAQRIVKDVKRDPLLSWIDRFKGNKVKDVSQIVPVVEENSENKKEALKKLEDALLDPDTKNKAYLLGIREELKKPITDVQVSVPIQPQETLENEINVKNSLGWLIAAVLGGTLFSLWLLGLIG